MPDVSTAVRIRPLDELDISGIVRIDEKISGIYRPEVWETRVMYYMRRDPGASQVAELGGKVVGFMLGELITGSLRRRLLKLASTPLEADADAVVELFLRGIQVIS